MNSEIKTPDVCPESNDSIRTFQLNDPVGIHMIQLRTYYKELHGNVCIIEQAIENIRKGKQVNMKNVILAPPSIPELHEEFSFRKPSDASSRTRPKLKVKECLSEDEGKLHRMCFVRKVLIQTGFDASDSECVSSLAEITDIFLENFSKELIENIRSDDFEEGDIMSPLETVLQRLKFGGIFGLYTFNQEILRKREVLLNDCQELYDRCEKLLEDLKCQQNCSTSGKSSKKTRIE